MMKSMRKTHPIIKIMNSSLIDLPSPSSISLWWNFGSLLGMTLMIQIITGLFLAMHYIPDLSMAFNSVIHIIRDMNYGWLIRNMHSNGASMFFICIYIHIGRGIYYGSSKLTYVWMSGIMILFMTMATAFLGYVLPWGQMSFWGATVITNLLSAIPYLGTNLVNWLWGGFSVSKATLTRFFVLHFIMPFIILMMVVIHLLFLHISGSNNPSGISKNIDKIPFHPYYSSKDIMGMMIILFMFMMMNLLSPRMFMDPENYIQANSLVTPIHIQPEWYFLFAYAILRSIPNKLGGVIGMMMAIMMLITIPMMKSMKFQSNKFYPLNQLMFWIFMTSAILLTWIGARPVEDPFIMIGQMITMLYFSYFMINPMITKLWDKLL